MKNTYPVLALLALCLVMACTKESGIISNTAAPAVNQSNNQYGMYGHTARYAAADYSQSIEVDTANRMLMSYLHSVGYPNTDTAIRSLSFDADTLRAYLQNPQIVTVKFMLAHKQSYINSGYEGKPSGMNPGALTMIIVGLSENNQYVRNSRSGVYDNMYPCPNNCVFNPNPLIQ
jgi:hypothetical protein